MEIIPVEQVKKGDGVGLGPFKKCSNGVQESYPNKRKYFQ